MKYIKYFIIFFIKLIQKTLLYISYYSVKTVSNQSGKYDWIIGTYEVANFIYLLKGALPNSYTVALQKNKYYSSSYNFSTNVSNKYLRKIYNTLVGPILLGCLMHKSERFIYIWSTGFLEDRAFEFEFLKSKNKIIICMFLGDDIRSPKLMTSFLKNHELDGFIEYFGAITPYYMSDEYDDKKKEIARIADIYADIIFSAEVDQKSYLTSKQVFPTYLYDKNKFNRNDDKFNNTKDIKILHAPSNPSIKGTSLVRAALKKLKEEGYKFDYVELQNMPNEVVLNHLQSSHIVLNQFYTFIPGMFAIEAMANHCAVLMSADSEIERGLPVGSKDAWMLTKYWEVYDNLKYLLDNPEKIQYYADKGYDFAYTHYTYEAAGKYINTVLRENGLIA